MTHKHGLLPSLESKVFALGTLYVVALLLSHATFPKHHVWAIAAFFSIAMNGTYVWAALRAGHHLRLETTIALTFIALSLLGVLVSPLFVITTIAAHGVWDVAKHYRVGVPFFSWYTWGCAVVDFTYATTLTLYYFR